SDLKPAPLDPAGNRMVTPRAPLFALLQAIVKQKPGAIGVDIDFSPIDGHFVTPADPDFFQHCLDLEKSSGVPIFLGVFRTHYGAPKDWLGDEKFGPLAATLGMPKGDVTHARAWLEQTGAPGVYLPSLSAALAGFSPNAMRGSWLSWAVESAREHKVNDKKNIAGENLIDYGKATALQEDAIKTAKPEVIDALPDKFRFTKKVVIIGDVEKPSGGDAFVIPGRNENNEPAPGVVVHACAVESLLAPPLVELTTAGHVLLDVLLSLAVLGCITGACLYAVHARHEVNLNLLYALLNGTAIVVIFIFGMEVVKSTRVVWDDFLLVIIALLLHRPCEHAAHAAGHALKHFGKAAWDAIFPAKSKPGGKHG
ncbi:MAG TPA: CHASE2 domain-containing protein, partial [Chthoniobacteraceae bacterium]|nr:CHASE2 domain-containing protein [Chthoniobacteraceae bacterium]